MPSMAAHMAVAKRVSELLKIDDCDFIKGNLLPDLFSDKLKSHFKIKSNIYYIPDIDMANKKIKYDKNIKLGYLTHLLLDKYFFDEYLSRYDNNLFEDSSIYDDYDILNKIIIDHFNLDTKYIKACLVDFPSNINKSKLKKNINCLDIISNNELKILNKDDFISFLEMSSNRIADYISNMR